jgi:Tol biopolymer transport system component
MSPEQASGRPTDARGDIFSFGIVLYEQLAGRRPFEGATDLELLQTIIHGTAQPLGADVPFALRMVVEKALEKDPADRYQSARDLVVDLRRVTRQSGDTTASPAAAKPKRKIRAPRHAVQFDIAPPAETTFAPPVMRQPFAISPDGTRLAFTATGPNGTHIWVRDLPSLDMRAVPGTDEAESVFWSPDSRSVYYSVKLTLKQADLETGSGRSVVEAPARVQLITWRSKEDLFLHLGMHGNYYEFLVQNGSLRETQVGKGTRWPQFLPGGQLLVYVVFDPSVHRFRAMVADYPGFRQVPLMETDSMVQYAPPRRPGETAHLLFLHGASLMAQPFDPDYERLAGEPFPIARNVIYYGATLSSSFSVSGNGVLVYQADFPISELKWYDRHGNDVGAAGRPAAYWGTLRVSADGRRVAAVVFNPENGGTDTWVFDANGRESRRLTFPPEVSRRPVWSPDGKRLVFGKSLPNGSPELATLDLDGNGREQSLQQAGPDTPHALPTDWSPDGRFIAFDNGIPEESPDAWLQDMATDKLIPLLQNKFPEWGIAFSPDGRQIAFVSAESGRPEVYLQAFESTPSPRLVGERRQVSRDGASLVRWRRAGRELFYLGTDNKLYAVPVSGVLQFGEPSFLFRVPGTPQYNTTRDFQFDVSLDGQRFLMTTTGSVPPPPFTVIQNWQDKFHR